MKNIISFFDRNFNLIFRKNRCVQFSFIDNCFEYQDIIFAGNSHFRCLGNNWYIRKIERP